MLPCLHPGVEAQPDYVQQRRGMVAEVRAMVRDTSTYTKMQRLAAPVLVAIDSVPRHEFVPQRLWGVAYENRPLPIGEGQTISQPYVVALMTDIALVDANSVVLEVGTGSGYQGAVLAEIAQHVYSIEIIESLGRRAASTLARLDYENVTVRIGDGYHGWPEKAPFDVIVVTAAPDQIPQPLIDQLKPGGRLVIPVGSQLGSQVLRVLNKDDQGRISIQDVLPVGFVPFTRAR